MANRNLSNKQKKVRSDSFLEAFRQTGNDFTDTFKNSLPFSNKPPQGISSAESGSPENTLFQRENDFEQRFNNLRRQTELVKRQEQTVYSAKERETQLQIKSLQNEIQQLAKATGTLAKEVQIASMQMPAEVGQYHITFFEKLRQLLQKLRSQINESSAWLAEFNKKSQKKNGYWGKYKKQGTTFSLHSDRSVATQTG